MLFLYRNMAVKHDCQFPSTKQFQLTFLLTQIIAECCLPMRSVQIEQVDGKCSFMEIYFQNPVIC